MTPEIDLFILLILTCILIYFHEWGHRLALGDKFISFTINPLFILTNGFMYKLTLFEWLYVTWNGFAFSSPILILTYFVLGSFWFVVAVALSLLSSIIDLTRIVLFFIIKHKEKAHFNQTMEELTHKDGLKRWKYLEKM